RLQAIGEARIVLEGSMRSDSVMQADSLPAVGNRTRAPWIAALAALFLAAVGWWQWLKPRGAEPHPVTRFTAATVQTNGFGVPSLSRDGTLLAYHSGNQFYVRSMDRLEARPVQGMEGAIANDVRFSPDNQWLAFTTNGQLRKVPLAGGAALTL